MSESRWIGVGIALHVASWVWTAALVVLGQWLRWRPRDHGRQSGKGW